MISIKVGWGVLFSRHPVCYKKQLFRG